MDVFSLGPCGCVSSKLQTPNVALIRTQSHRSADLEAVLAARRTSAQKILGIHSRAPPVTWPRFHPAVGLERRASVTGRGLCLIRPLTAHTSNHGRAPEILISSTAIWEMFQGFFVALCGTFAQSLP